MIDVPSLVGEVVTGTTVLTQASTVPQPELETNTVALADVLAWATSVTTFSGYIGCDFGNPTLQMGGVHDAMIVAPPPLLVPVATPPLAVTDPDAEELQVNGTFRMVVPEVSTTVGVIDFEFVDEPVTSSAIDCTGQVVKLNGTLLVLPMSANSGVKPGFVAVTCT
jgi:hypothetical protein